VTAHLNFYSSLHQAICIHTQIRRGCRKKGKELSSGGGGWGRTRPPRPCLCFGRIIIIGGGRGRIPTTLREPEVRHRSRRCFRLHLGSNKRLIVDNPENEQHKKESHRGILLPMTTTRTTTMSAIRKDPDSILPEVV
jgi:hypothetical protein